MTTTKIQCDFCKAEIDASCEALRLLKDKDTALVICRTARIEFKVTIDTSADICRDCALLALKAAVEGAR